MEIVMQFVTELSDSLAFVFGYTFAPISIVFEQIFAPVILFFNGLL